MSIETVKPNSENKDEQLIFFFSGRSCFSNFYICKFKVDGIIFSSMEQFFHYKKAELFDDKHNMQKILSASNPMEQKRLGRNVRNYKEEVWEKKGFMFMKQGLHAKFNQNKKLLKHLLAIENGRFVEASPYDRKWGIGINEMNANATKPSLWPGSNLLGIALTTVRDKIKEEQTN
jgi:ribA/ribD-fused uncharacterized protein